MTLSAVIERIKADREAWRYTNLDAVEALFNETVIASRQRHRSDPVLASDNSPCQQQKDWIASLPTAARNDAGGKHGARLAFVDGVWQPEQSRFHGLPSEVLQGNAQSGYCLTFGKQTSTATPFLELLFLNTPGSKPSETGTKLRTILKSGAAVTLVERHVPSNRGEPFAHIIENEIVLEPQAKLAHGKIVTSSANVHLARTRVKAEQNAVYDSFALIGSGKPLRNEIDVTLAGERAECRLHGLMLLRDGDHADATIRVVHAAPHTSSRQLYRAVIGGKARGVFQGKIAVNEGAQKSDGYQLCRALLLSGQAEMDAKPELEIYADDVKCSHGCTIGNLDDDALFYLRSRGIGANEARALLVEAFAGEVADNLPQGPLRNAAKWEVEAWLHR